MNIQFIKYSKIWLGISAGIILVSIILLSIFGLRAGIDFTGGSLMELSFSDKRPENNQVMDIMETKLNLPNSVIQKTAEKSLIIRTKFLDEKNHQLMLGSLKEKFETDKNKIIESRFETIGAVVSSQLTKRAIWAVIFVILGIVLFVAYAFRKVSRPVASWKYGILAIVALIHDVLVVLAVFAVLGRFWGVEVNIAIVVALLTVLGYSVNDTIVVYDRIRENLLRTRWDSLSEAVNSGLNQSLMRSINTTITTLLPLLTLYFLGGSTIHYFSLALIIGIASGAYSSIFIASPLLVVIEKWKK
ncbi:MAG: protein translocase subunit SecF [bacterium]